MIVANGEFIAPIVLLGFLLALTGYALCAWASLELRKIKAEEKALEQKLEKLKR